MASRPTHVIEHLNGWIVHVTIHRNVLNRLYDRDPDRRNNARKSVCIQFRKAAQSKYGNKWTGGNWVEWKHIKITPITSPKPDHDDRFCDDCAMCDIGYHERCRQSDGCPIAISYR